MSGLWQFRTGIWYKDVKAAGDEGKDFYHAYYNDHPERGLQQGGGPAGGFELDRKFLSDSALGTAFVPFAFFGLSVIEDGVLHIAPALPSALQWLAVENVYFNGNHLRIEVGHDYVDFKGSKLPKADGLSVVVHLNNAKPGQIVLVDGQPVIDVQPAAKGGSVIKLPLHECHISLR